MIVGILVEKAKQDILRKYQEIGLDQNNPEQMQQFQEEMSHAEQLVQSELKFKTYQTMA